MNEELTRLKTLLHQRIDENVELELNLIKVWEKDQLNKSYLDFKQSEYNLRNGFIWFSSTFWTPKQTYKSLIKLYKNGK